MIKQPKLLSLFSAVVISTLVLMGSGCTSSTTTPSSTPNSTTTVKTTDLVSISFGRQGGNIKPFTISIAKQGVISSDYESTCIKKGATVSEADLKQVVAMIKKIETPSSAPSTTTNITRLVNPDIAKRFISLVETGKTSGFSPTEQNQEEFDKAFELLLSLTSKKNCNF